MKSLRVGSIVISIAAAVVLNGCFDDSKVTEGLNQTPVANSGGDQAQVDSAKGRYVDSGVDGVEYKCGVLSGVTKNGGEFEFEKGSDCEFKLGDLILKKISKENLDENVTIVEDNPKIAAILQTLDKDGDPENGITLPDKKVIEEVLKNSDLKSKLEEVVKDELNSSKDQLKDNKEENQEEIAKLQEILNNLHQHLKEKLSDEYNGKVVNIEKAKEHLQKSASKVLATLLNQKDFYVLVDKEKDEYLHLIFNSLKDLGEMVEGDATLEKYQNGELIDQVQLDVEIRGNIIKLVGDEEPHVLEYEGKNHGAIKLEEEGVEYYFFDSKDKFEKFLQKSGFNPIIGIGDKKDDKDHFDKDKGNKIGKDHGSDNDINKSIEDKKDDIDHSKEKIDKDHGDFNKTIGDKEEKKDQDSNLDNIKDGEKSKIDKDNNEKKDEVKKEIDKNIDGKDKDISKNPAKKDNDLNKDDSIKDKKDGNLGDQKKEIDKGIDDDKNIENDKSKIDKGIDQDKDNMKKNNEDKNLTDQKSNQNDSQKDVDKNIKDSNSKINKGTDQNRDDIKKEDENLTDQKDNQDNNQNGDISKDNQEDQVDNKDKVDNNLKDNVGNSNNESNLDQQDQDKEENIGEKDRVGQDQNNKNQKEQNSDVTKDENSSQVDKDKLIKQSI